MYLVDNITVTTTPLDGEEYFAEAAMDDRIEQHRKGNFGVALVNPDSSPLAGLASVSLSLDQHEFLWGSALATGTSFASDAVKEW